MPATPLAVRRSAAVRLPLAVLTTIALCVALLAATPPRAEAHATGWDCLAHYESTHRWGINTGNGHYGGLQFSLSTWRYFGGPQHSGNTWPHKATRREQIAVAKRVAFHGWKDRRPQGGRSAWPNTWTRCF